MMAACWISEPLPAALPMPRRRTVSAAAMLCVINRIYDQSGKGNDLMQAPPGPLYPGPDKGAFDAQPIADMAPIHHWRRPQGLWRLHHAGHGLPQQQCPGSADR